MNREWDVFNVAGTIVVVAVGFFAWPYVERLSTAAGWLLGVAAFVAVIAAIGWGTRAR